MSIASAIATKQQQIADSYTAVSNKGGTLPATQNLTNLATAISSIPSGGGGYSELPSYQVENGVASKITKALTGNEFSNITSISNNGMVNAYYNCTGLIGVLDLSSVTSIDALGLYNAFYGCSGITSVILSSLTSVSMFALGYAFEKCTGITDIYFNSLTTTSFGSSKNQFTSMMGSTGSTVTHTLHFPSNLESTISGLSGYPLFGGTSGYVVCAFDLPATS